MRILFSVNIVNPTDFSAGGISNSSSQQRLVLAKEETEQRSIRNTVGGVYQVDSVTERTSVDVVDQCQRLEVGHTNCVSSFLQQAALGEGGDGKGLSTG